MERRFQKPFDAELHVLMCQVAEALVEDLQGVFAYVQFDEISLVLPRGWALFDRRMEKIVKVEVERRRIAVDPKIPIGEAFGEYAGARAR